MHGHLNVKQHHLITSTSYMCRENSLVPERRQKFSKIIATDSLQMYVRSQREGRCGISFGLLLGLFHCKA